jgi:putative transposase
VDTGGYLVEVKVHSAQIQDREGAKPLLEAAKPKCPRVTAVFADSGYTGTLKAWMKGALDWDLLLVKRPRFKRQLFGKEIVTPGMAVEEKKNFPILPKRWVVERTFAWLGRYRPLSKDYEQLCKSEETLIRMASARLIMSRFANGYF